MAQAGDNVVVTSGVLEDISGSTNIMRVEIALYTLRKIQFT